MYRISYYDVIDESIIKEIILKKPVNIAICTPDLFNYAPTENNRTLHCNPKNRILSAGVLLIGYTETEWIIKNSWG